MREERDVRERRDPKFGVRGSENPELRTSNIPPSRQSRSAILREYSPAVQDVRTIEPLFCLSCFSAACYVVGEPWRVDRRSWSCAGTAGSIGPNLTSSS